MELHKLTRAGWLLTLCAAAVTLGCGIFGGIWFAALPKLAMLPGLAIFIVGWVLLSLLGIPVFKSDSNEKP